MSVHRCTRQFADERRANGRDKPWTLDYVGLGNEMWGCGGDQTAEEASAEMRRFATYLQIGPKLIASGASDRDYHWTEVLMGAAGPYHGPSPFYGVSLHYYTLPTGKWEHKGSAIGFPESEWASTLARTRELEGMIQQHAAIMDKADPEKKIGLMVDEWGTWYDPAPGSNPAFLVQDNTLRDALVAATNFHIFQRHADRVRMASDRADGERAAVDDPHRRTEDAAYADLLRFPDVPAVPRGVGAAGHHQLTRITRSARPSYRRST